MTPSSGCPAGGQGCCQPDPTLTPSLCPPPFPGRPPGSPAAGEGRLGAGEPSAGPEGTQISQDLVGRSLAIDTLPANETRIVVSWGPDAAPPNPPPKQDPAPRKDPAPPPLPRAISRLGRELAEMLALI